MANNNTVAPSSTLHYSRDESSTAQALSGTTTARGTWTRTHSRAPSQKSAFGMITQGPGQGQGQSINGRGNASVTDDDDSSEGGGYGLRGSNSGLLDGQDDLGDLENEEGQHFWVNTRHLTSGNPASLSDEEQSGQYRNASFPIRIKTDCLICMFHQTQPLPGVFGPDSRRSPPRSSSVSTSGSIPLMWSRRLPVPSWNVG